MKYYFSEFYFDTKTNQLIGNNQKILLTKKSYQLLIFFIQNPQKIHSKQELIESVWGGRIVSDNTIDQSISKLKKILNELKPDKYIESVYGQGVRFVASVDRKQKKINKLLLCIIGPIALLILFLFWSNKPHIDKHFKPIVVVIPKAVAQIGNSELQSGIHLLWQQLLHYSNLAHIKGYQNKSNNLDDKQFIEKQWKISPSMNILATSIENKDDEFVLNLQLTNSRQKQVIKHFSNKNLIKVFTQGSQWLTKTFNNSGVTPSINSLIPKSSHVLELYIRGLHNLNNGKLENAQNYFELCIKDQADFHLARFELAKTVNKRGLKQQALTLLEKAFLSELLPVLEIEIELLRASIYASQEKHDDAKDILLLVLEKHKILDFSNTIEIRYLLSQVYSSVTENELALEQLDVILQHSSIQKSTLLHAEILQFTGRIHQRLGQQNEAATKAMSALEIYNQTGDLLGSLKVYLLLASVSNSKANYSEATKQLEHALVIARSLNNTFESANVITELIRVLLYQGQHNKAWKLNQELKDIATKDSSSRLLLASKKIAITIAQEKRQWQIAESYLAEHRELATASNKKSELITNQILQVSLLLDQDKIEQVKALISQVQAQIDKQNGGHLQSELNFQLARFYLKTGQSVEAVSILLAVKNYAHEIQDTKLTIKANNLLAEHYLSQELTEKTFNILKESAFYKPSAKPYLLLFSKAFYQSNQAIKALELANQCKIESADLWFDEDEIYLNELKNTVIDNS